MRQRMPRVHNEAHLDFIRGLPCVSCGNDIETQAAHLRSDNRMYGKTSSGMQMKPDDRWTLPLCGRCHDAQHKGNEMNFWKGLGINPFVLALSLFAASGDHELAQEVISRQVSR